MGQTVGNNEWAANVYLFEQTDLVLAETDNVPLQQLANRTRFLYERMGRITQLYDVVDISASVALDNSVLGKLVNVTGTDNVVITLPLPGINNYPEGGLIFFACSLGSGKSLTVKTSNIVGPGGVDGIQFYGQPTGELYLHSAEHLILVRKGMFWHVVTCSPGMIETGDEFMSRAVRRNTLIKQGQLVSRQDFPRLFKWVQSLTEGVTTEANWFSLQFQFKGFFTLGTDGTNFRLPDERGMFERALDLGRGVDVGRQDNVAGGFEDDALKQHTHEYVDRYYPENNPNIPNKIALPVNYNNRIGSNDTDYDNTHSAFIAANTGNTGVEETRPKNIGKYPLIKI
jgi:hypothetical protein